MITDDKLKELSKSKAKTPFGIVTSLKNIIGNERERAYWISNEIPIGHGPKSQITIRGFGHWVWDRESGECKCFCRNASRAITVASKLKFHGIDYTVDQL